LWALHSWRRKNPVFSQLIVDEIQDYQSLHGIALAVIMVVTIVAILILILRRVESRTPGKGEVMAAMRGKRPDLSQVILRLYIFLAFAFLFLRSP